MDLFSEAGVELRVRHRPRTYKTKNGRTHVLPFFVLYVREKIRTPDTLVRSQVLYPAELHAHKMLVAGLEPARGCPRGILSPLRLPIPPHQQAVSLSSKRK